MIDEKLLNYLVCPVDKGPLTPHAENEELVCEACNLGFPVRDGIPVMLESEARKLDTEGA